MTLTVMGLFLFSPLLSASPSRDDRERAEADFRQGEAFRAEGGIRGRMLARRYFQKAVDHDPDNIRYLLAMAGTWRASGFPDNARRLFLRITELDPGNLEAHLQLAELYAADTDHYSDMYSEGGRISFKSFSDRDGARALAHYRSILALEPDHRRALRGLALYYLRHDQPSELVRFGRRLTELDPANPEGYLLAGIGSTGKAEFREAHEFYAQALARLPQGRGEAYNSLASILSPEEAAAYSDWGPEARGRFETVFWKKHDPLYLTGYNERELIHFSRIAAVDILYGDPERGVRGWETDRGRVHIRYGRPGGVFKDWLAYDERWHYPDFSLRFEDYFRSGSYRFAWSGYSDPLDTDWMRYEGIVRDRPTYHFVDFKGRRFGFPQIVSTFKDRELDKTLLEISFGVPLPRLLVDDSLDAVGVREGIFVFDSDYRMVASRIEEKDFNLPYDFRARADQYLIDQQLISLPPGSYTLAVEVADKRGETFGASHRQQRVRSYRGNDERLSDLTLASKVFKRRGISFFREDLAVHPNPLMEFHRSEGLAVYFGVYNLALGPDGRSRYEISTRISRIDNREGLTGLVAGIIGGRRGEGLAISSNYSGLFPDEIRVLTVDLEHLPAARYRLQIEVRDLLSGVVRTREREFRLVD